MLLDSEQTKNKNYKPHLHKCLEEKVIALF
jgi:hypothetical protein